MLIRKDQMKKREHELNCSAFILLLMSATIIMGFISGIRPCAVISGSMEPNLPTWSLCFVNTRASYDSVQTGDIAVYNKRFNDTRIIHRVIEITPGRMITKGDANPVSDGLSVGREKMNRLSFFQRIHLTLPLRGDDTILLVKKRKEDFYNE